MSNPGFRTGMQFFLGTILPTLAHAPPACPCYQAPGLPPPSSLDVLRGLHDCVCSLNAKFDRHETPLRAVQACCQLIGLASSTETCLMHSRRTLPNGDPDPTDTSKQRPDLVIYDFHNGGSNPTLVDITVTHPTARCHSRLLT